MCYNMMCRYQDYQGDCRASKEQMKRPDAKCNLEDMACKFEEKFGHNPTDEELDNFIAQEVSEYE